MTKLYSLIASIVVIVPLMYGHLWQGSQVWA